jgi:hypothetical protein
VLRAGDTGLDREVAAIGKSVTYQDEIHTLPSLVVAELVDNRQRRSSLG